MNTTADTLANAIATLALGATDDGETRRAGLKLAAERFGFTVTDEVAEADIEQAAVDLGVDLPPRTTWNIIDLSNGEIAGQAPGRDQLTALSCFNRDALESAGELEPPALARLRGAPALVHEGTRYGAEVETSALQADDPRYAAAPDEVVTGAMRDAGLDVDGPIENTRQVTIEIGDADLDYIADSLRLLADLDEGEHVDDDRLRRLAGYLHGYTR